MSRPRQAMTVLELLIVVGVIVVLAAILMPSMTNVKLTAKRVACQQKLRIVSLGLISYADDYGGYLPPTVQRCDENERPDLSGNVLYYRDLNFDLPSTLSAYVQSEALRCPEPGGPGVSLVDPCTSVVYSNYLFLWGTVKGTPVEGYVRKEKAPGWAVEVLDLTWNIYLNGRMIYGGNHLKAGGTPALPFIAAKTEKEAGNQYTLSSLAPIKGMNAAFFDGSAQWLDRRDGTWRDAGPFDQGGFRDSRVYLPARYGGDPTPR